MTPKKRPAPASTPPSEPPKPTKDMDLGKELGTIYSEQGLGPLDMSRLEKTSHSTLKKVLVGMIAFFGVLAAVSWAGFFFFSPDREKFSGDGVTLDVEGPGEVRSGEVTTMLIRWKNGEGIALGTSSLELRLPKEFHLQSADPSGERNVWQIGSIAPGKEGSVKITGVFLAPLQKQLDIQAILTYRPADFNSEFQKVSTRAVTVADSIFELAVAGPPKVLPGDKVTLTLGYRNASDNAFEEIRLRALFPPTFIPESATPAAMTEAKNEWLLPKLDPGADGEITVTGTFASDAKGDIEIKAQIGIVDLNDEFQLQKESAFAAEVLEGDLVTLLILGGKTENQSVSFGETLHYAVTYRNTGNVSLGDVSFTVTFEAEPDAEKVLLWNKLKDREEGVRDDNTITWSKRQISSLGKVTPGQEGTIDFDLPILEAPIEGTTGADYRITASVESVVELIDGEEVKRVTKTQPVVARVLSDTSIASDARYFNDEGIPVGSGPLPPVVGQQTTYRVSWTLANSLHELNDLKISAKLPANVIWSGKSSVDAGDLRFDAAGEKMIWSLNWLPTTIKSLTVSFDLILTPEAAQEGKVASLIDATIFEATDKVTGTPVLLSTPPLTTSLENDEAATGKARVKAE
jgi:hypothetical protein